MEKNTNNYVIKEIFYSNGVTFRKERFNKETGEEITQYFSKNGEFIVEIKNSTLNIHGFPICYWDYDADDRLTEFGIYINSKRRKISKKRYFYGISD